MITFKKITIQGFGSVIQPITYGLSKIGLNKIEGENGSGKTTITNALSWVLYKKLVKKGSTFKPWDSIRDDNYVGTCVDLIFTDGNKDKFHIIRCDEFKNGVLGRGKGANRLIILKNGEEIDTKDLRNKADYEKWIVNKIGYSFDLFKSTILFAQELDRLMKEDGPSKKKIFDEAFETVFINRAKEISEKKVQSLQKDHDTVNTVIQMLNLKIQNVSQLIGSENKNLENFSHDIKQQIRAIRLKNSLINANIYELDTTITNLLIIASKVGPLVEIIRKQKKKINPTIVTDEFKKSLEINGYQTKLENCVDRINTLKEDFKKPNKTVCSYCGSTLNKKDSKKHIQTEITSLGLERNVLKSQISNLKFDYEEILLSVKANKDQEDKLKSLENELRTLEKQTAELPMQKKVRENQDTLLKQNLKDIKALKKKKPKESNLPELKAKLAILNDRLYLSNKEEVSIKKKLELQKWLLKFPLSNSGLKAFIFDSMIGKTNNHLKYYTPIIGFSVRVFIDLKSANKDIRIIVQKKGQDVLYEDLSKGQKQLTDVALAFALNDTVNSAKPTNLLIMDEIFENLDKANIEKVGNIIAQKSLKKSLHLITHQSSFSPSNCRVTYVSLNDKGQTVLDSSN